VPADGGWLKLITCQLTSGGKAGSPVGRLQLANTWYLTPGT